MDFQATVAAFAFKNATDMLKDMLVDDPEEGLKLLNDPDRLTNIAYDLLIVSMEECVPEGVKADNLREVFDHVNPVIKEMVQNYRMDIARKMQTIM